MKTEKARIKEIVLILENIRSAENVGAMFRTADGVGVSKLYLVGTTPAPFDEFNRPNAKITKTALGAEMVIPWKSAVHIAPLVKRLKQAGYTICALEQNTHSKHFTSKIEADKIALIVGNEVDGVSNAAISLSDVLLEIPMRGIKESLNVSVAAGIALYAITA